VRRVTGRRCGESGTRGAILAAARDHFAAGGFNGASLRAIAAAGVDTGLIRHFFGCKDNLFIATLQVPDEAFQWMRKALDGDVDRLGERMVDAYLRLWENPVTAEPLLAVARSAISSQKGTNRLRAVCGGSVFHDFLPHVAADRPETRIALAGAHLMGVALARYVVQVPPLANLDRDELIATCAPVIQRYLTEPLPLPVDALHPPPEGRFRG
jgi:AcrR family transcriptional regulator